MMTTLIKLAEGLAGLLMAFGALALLPLASRLSQ